VGGSHVKLLTTGEEQRRRFASGPALGRQKMVDGVLEAAADWAWDVASVGIPSPVRDGQVVAEPVNLGEGWVGFELRAGFRTAAFQPDYIVIGGGEAKELDELPAGCRRGANENAFVGGFRLWAPEWNRRPHDEVGGPVV